MLWNRVHLRHPSWIRESCLPTFHNEELVGIFGALCLTCYQTLQSFPNMSFSTSFCLSLHLPAGPHIHPLPMIFIVNLEPQKQQQKKHHIVAYVALMICHRHGLLWALSQRAASRAGRLRLWQGLFAASRYYLLIGSYDTGQMRR